MAEFGRLKNYVAVWEGGLSSDPRDLAAQHPSPVVDPKRTPSHYHTNKGITWATFSSPQVKALGIDPAPEAFVHMAEEMWLKIMKGLYWDAVWGDKIANQKSADLLMDFAWGSGPGTAVQRLQGVLKNKFGKAISVDGGMGPKTLEACNSVDGALLFSELCKDRRWFLLEYLGSQKTFAWAKQGWKNRIDYFEKWESAQAT